MRCGRRLLGHSASRRCSTVAMPLSIANLHAKGLPAEVTELERQLRELQARLAQKRQMLAELETTGAVPSGYAQGAAAAGTSDIDRKVAAQGDKVRALKQAKAPKDEIQREVAVLLELKKQAAAAPAPAPAPAAAAAAAAAAPTDLDRKVAEQGDKVRALKAQKAPKDEIQREVAVLLELKKQAAAQGGAPAPAAAKAPAAPKTPRDWRFDTLRSVGEECQEDEELAQLILRKEKEGARPRCYDGFEPSGRMHIAQGVFKTINVNKCTKAGCTFVFWVADWFALMNDKMGGSLERIRTVGKYLVEVWRAVGMNLDHVEFVWSSDEINKHAKEYWTQMLDVARHFTLARIIKCGQIMGRGEDAGLLTAAQILYPLMQCTDIFFLRADICQLGLDQRKVNMLAREYCDKKQGGRVKPVVLSHHMMAGLKAGQVKMSKSDPDSAIFMEDKAEDVVRKIMGAHCPTSAEVAAGGAANPVMDYLESIVFTSPGATFEAGGKKFESCAAVQNAFDKGDLKEQALKESLAAVINRWVQPVRDWFEKDPTAKDIFQKVRKYKEEVIAEAKSGPPPVREVTPPTDADKKWYTDLVGWAGQQVCKGWNQTAASPPAAVGAQPSVLIPILPSVHPRLNEIFSIAHHARTLAAQGSKVRLLLLDWSGFVLNAAKGNQEEIKTVLEFTQKCVLALLADAKGVEVRWQSESILSDPDAYWVGVIGAGRAHKLAQIRTALGLQGPVQEGESVGGVIASLMFIRDCVSHGCDVVAAPSQLLAVAELAAAHARAGQGAVPTVVSLPNMVPCLKQDKAADAIPNLAGLSVDKLTHAGVLFAADTRDELAKKVKTGFCEPGAVAGNPVIDVALAAMLVTQSPLEVKRDPKWGGDMSFSTAAEIAKAVADGSLHPGDLKPAVSRLLADVADRLARAVPEDLTAEVRRIGAAAVPSAPTQAGADKSGKKKKK
eukprot:TRINITY_DN643_c0_g2_i2.p1 TRINITY_DN643_c0_g2~~TRINITY_DN643_c0_g2_i2.p1  ORF type:complete len:951 (+),score=406.87 TRINITY_DN643_c0_g2_i2:39-2891(+)